MSDSSLRKPPRWTEPFLLALVRTGEVREAAKWAGVDFTTAYARRKAHADFAEAWEAALEMHRAAVVRAEAEALAALAQDHADVPSPGSAAPSPTSPAGGRGAQEKRANSARWTDAKERRFFDELVASANVRRAAEAAGVSVQTVYARRAKHAPFRLRWAQALENGRAAIETHLVAQAQRALDPETMDLPDPAPRVSVSEGIKIAQMGPGQGRGGASRGYSGAFSDDDAADHERQKEELRQRLMTKLDRLRERLVRDDGWTEDEKYGVAVPPGWIRDPSFPR